MRLCLAGKASRLSYLMVLMIFLTWITTGEKGDASQAYQDDIAIASDDIFQSYIGTSNVIVAVLNNYFRDAYTDYLESVKKKGSR